MTAERLRKLRVCHLHRVGAALLRASSFVTITQAEQSLLGAAVQPSVAQCVLQVRDSQALSCQLMIIYNAPQQDDHDEAYCRPSRILSSQQVSLIWLDLIRNPAPGRSSHIDCASNLIGCSAYQHP